MKMRRCAAGVLLGLLAGNAVADVVDVRFWLVRSDRIDTPTTFDPTQQDQDMTTTGYGGLYSETPDVYALEYNLATTDQFYYIFGKFDNYYTHDIGVIGLALDLASTGTLQFDVTWYQFTGNDQNPDAFRWDANSDFDGSRCKLMAVNGTGWCNTTTEYDTGDLYTPYGDNHGSSSICLGAVRRVSGFGELLLGLSWDGIYMTGTGNTGQVFFGDDDAPLPDDPPGDAPWFGPDDIAEGAFVPEPAAIGLMLGLLVLLRRR